MFLLLILYIDGLLPKTPTSTGNGAGMFGRLILVTCIAFLIVVGLAVALVWGAWKLST